MYKIAVVGCGVIGLPTALYIQEKLNSKVQVTIFTDQLSPHTTGDIAAGLWTPYLHQETPIENIIRWSKITQDFILDLWKKGEAKIAGISLQMVISLTTDPAFSLPPWVKIALGYSELTPEHLQSYSRKYKQQFTGGFSYVTFIWEAARFLPYLKEKFLENGGILKIKRVDNFKQLSDFDVIVNCTGIKSRYLVPDPLVEPIRGQIARVEAPWQFHTFFVDIGDGGNYIIPNIDNVILGGTHQTGDYNTSIDQQDIKFILEGNSRFVPSLRYAKVIKHQVGLRPGRKQIRLELEIRNVGNKQLKIVHNYGHGGCGITLAIGCAQDAAQLVQHALNLISHKL